jgi:hypothetical protein
MHIFIDESGTFAPANASAPSISAVAALVVPGAILAALERKYLKMREDLPKSKGEVKGRLLSESQIATVVSLLSRHQVLFEVTVVDMAIHDTATIDKHRATQAEEITANLTPRHRPAVREALFGLRRQLEGMTNQLYVQSVVTYSLLETVIQHCPLYYAQRMPRELGVFYWVIDAKAPDQITAWETWWSTTVLHMLQWRSLTNPAASLEGADYSHFERYRAKLPAHLKQHVADPERDDAFSLTMLLKEHFRFSAQPEPGLELVDILANATRRALVGSLDIRGWKGLPCLMIHRKHQYIEVSTFGDSMKNRTRPYFPVLAHFMTGGKRMLAPRFARSVDD